MKKARNWLAALCLLFVGCQSTAASAAEALLKRYVPASGIPFSEIDNVRIDELHKRPNTFVFAINRDTGDQGRGAYWGTLDEIGWIRFYESGPRTSLFQVSLIAISDDDRFLAVETTGEGHPVLDVFELQDWLHYAPRGMDRDAPPVEPIATLNPYPFSLKSIGWRDNHFVIQSHGRLDEIRERRRTGRTQYSDEELESNESHVFLWNVESDQIQVE